MMTKEVATDLSPLLRVYKDGSIDRFLDTPIVPPSNDPDSITGGISSKDVTISPHASARLYLPKDVTISPHASARLYLPKPAAATDAKKLPILVYFHGGGFCFESAFNFLHHRYISAIVAESNALVVSIEYRLAPEHPLPFAYEDCWVALQWVASHDHCGNDTQKEPWLAEYGDFDRVFLGGDSAGGNIVHNIAMRAGNEPLEGGVKLVGAFLSHPYFWGSKPLIGYEPPEVNTEQSLAKRVWDFVYPSAPKGLDNPMINPFSEDAPSLAGLGCCRLLVCVAEKDELRARGVKYYEEVQRSGWNGEIEIFEVKGEEHAFHVHDVNAENAKKMIKCLASFIH